MAPKKQRLNGGKKSPLATAPQSGTFATPHSGGHPRNAPEKVVEPLFKIPQKWESLTLGDACKRGGGAVQTGPFGSQLHAADYVPIGIPSVMPQNIADNRINEDEIARIKESDAARLTKYRLKEGDIVYSRRGDVERRALVRSRENGWLCGTGCLRIRFGEGHVLPTFAAHYLGHPIVREWIVRHAHGATMPNLNTSILSELPMALPPYNVQELIANILGSLDDKIENNRRMNETLEALARALFKDWFVDFGPVRAKMEGRKPPGLSPEVAALFPGELDEAGKPIGWVEKPLDKIAEFLNGLALQNFPGNSIDGLPVIKIAELRSGITSKSGRASKNIPSKYVIENGDVIFSWSGSLTQIVWTGGTGALNQHLFKVSSEVYPKWFHYFWVDHYLPEFQAIAASKATTMGHIQRHHLTQALVVTVEETLMNALDKIIDPIFSLLIKNEIQMHDLKNIRDTLLPKLLSGEIQV